MKFGMMMPISGVNVENTDQFRLIKGHGTAVKMHEKNNIMHSPDHKTPCMRTGEISWCRLDNTKKDSPFPRIVQTGPAYFYAKRGKLHRDTDRAASVLFRWVRVSWGKNEMGYPYQYHINGVKFFFRNGKYVRHKIDAVYSVETETYKQREMIYSFDGGDDHAVKYRLDWLGVRGTFFPTDLDSFSFSCMGRT